MSILSVANLKYAIGDQLLLEGVNLTLEAGEHVALVGRNGCGKSTLLRMLAADAGLRPDSGEVQQARGSSIGYLTQDPQLDSQNTLRVEAASVFADLEKLHHRVDQITAEMVTAAGDQLDRLMKSYERLERQIHSAGGYAVDHRIDATLHGVGLGDELFNVQVGNLSGGQKGRLALAKLLLASPDVLLLDEPTNHLDIEGRQWLEQYLAASPSAIILVSHDRWLLDRVVSKIYELENGQIEQYPGQYTQYRQLRAERRLADQRAYDRQQQFIRREQGFIDRYRAGQRSKQAQGREKRLERLLRDDRLGRPVEADVLRAHVPAPSRSGDLVMAAESVGKAYGERVLFADVSLAIKRGDRIGVIGPNGCGKTTLVNCLLGRQSQDGGHVRRGAQVNVGYLQQMPTDIDPSLTVVEYLRRFVPGATEQAARDLAGAFLFSGVDQDKTMGVLSGGERTRAALAGLIVGGHNLLVLDEPTNHLDIPSAEQLEWAIRTFLGLDRPRAPRHGTLILITHDRMLLDAIVNQLLVFDGHGHVTHFLGTYSEYLAACPAADSPLPAVSDAAGQPSKPSRARAKPPAGDRVSLLSDTALEACIVELESQLAEIDQQLADPSAYRDGQKVKSLQNRRAAATEELAPLERQWLERADR